MKSKTVASIMRHVASKVPSINATGEELTAMAEAEAENKEAKKSRRAKKDAGDEEPLEEAAHSGPISSANEEERMEQLYEQITWPLAHKYGHPYDAFKLALT